MARLQRIHRGFILGAAGFRFVRWVAFLLLLNAGCIWLIQRSFTGRTVTVLTVCVCLWGVRAVIRAVGELLPPPEPIVKTGTRLERRRALRRAGMLERR